ncbi:hypothetical protein Desku_1580 [Desulfofundulus kuznetsovii DSM 6115]|jgi:hypothetical protein|uniref:Uncharacterized protein n=1 Tax=Desulfofundulus kuznetsovii (strain DSM 6115 / VKM B-1805 / 17) TaxID=760568 RepID=A0AAU8PPX6_DESK7|nr:hypothetical protein Desku_1580 [Desulfofundulus kuznetsovii DSM 6115]
MTKSINRLISETARYAQKAGKDITEADVRDRFQDYIRRHGEEKALIALRNTLESFREQARVEETRLFCLVRAECLRKFGVAPANRRTFKAELRENPGLYESVPSVKEYMKRFCG